MKRLSLVFVAMSLCISIALAATSVPIDPVKVAYIARHIKLAEDMDTEIDKVQKRLAVAKTPATIKKLTNDIINLRNTQDGLFQDTIRLTCELYHIAPPLNHMPIVVGKFKDKTSTWDPRYERLAPRVVRAGDDVDSEQVNLIPDEDDIALTWTDGHMSITRKAFKSPGFLASVLYHETIHFEQITTPGQADRMTRKQMEFSAYTLAQKRDTLYALTTYEIAVLSTSFQQAMIDAALPGNLRLAGIEGVEAEGSERDRILAETGFLQETAALPQLTEEMKEAFLNDDRLARLERERADRKALALKEEAAQKAALDRTNEIARMYEFKLEDINYGLIMFKDARLNAPSDLSYVFKAKYQDDVLATLFMIRSCIDLEVAQPSEMALKILQKQAGSAEFKERVALSMSYYSGDATHCMDFLLTNPDWLTTSSDMQTLLAKLKKQAREADKHRKKQIERSKANEARNKALEKKMLRDRERAEERGAQGQPSGDRSIDLSPERETLRKYRGH